MEEGREGEEEGRGGEGMERWRVRGVGGVLSIHKLPNRHKKDRGEAENREAFTRSAFPVIGCRP
jgi:hypothetical protein